MCMLSVCVIGGCLVSALLWLLLQLLLPPIPAIVLAALPGMYYMIWNWRMSRITLLNSYASDEERETALDLAMFGPEKLDRVKGFRTKIRWREYEESQKK